MHRAVARASRPARSTSWSRRWAWPASPSLPSGRQGRTRGSQVSRLCAEIDERVRTFLERPIEGDWPYLWIDATYVKVREAGRIVSVAVTIAVAVNTDGRREVLGMAIGAAPCGAVGPRTPQ